MGCLPYLQDTTISGFNLENLLCDNREAFWDAHAKFNETSKKLSSEFKQFFEGLTSKNPNLRLSVSQIRKDTWFNGPTYKQEELVTVMKSILLQKK
mmetsp:Transcript_27350/g.24118  ORF Transcript_27350/g.24118 Transcript_27350/m.24118 type:complete len:96 (+) Transcript_27350:695-982(+)